MNHPSIFRIDRISSIVLALLVICIASCGGDDTDTTPSCGVGVWRLFRFDDTGTSSFDYDNEMLNVSVDNASVLLEQSPFFNDFTARLTFTNLQLTEGGYFQIGLRESFEDSNGNGVSFSGIAASAISYGSSNRNRVISNSGFSSEADVQFGLIDSQTNDSGAIRISKKGNVLAVDVEIGFESFSTSAQYEFTLGSSLAMVVTLGSSPSGDSGGFVSLTDFRFDGNGALSDDFKCSRLIE